MYWARRERRWRLEREVRHAKSSRHCDLRFDFPRSPPLGRCPRRLRRPCHACYRFWLLGFCFQLSETAKNWAFQGEKRRWEESAFPNAAVLILVPLTQAENIKAKRSTEEIPPRRTDSVIRATRFKLNND